MTVETKIHIGERAFPLKFSFMTIREIEKAGYPMATLESAINNSITGLLIEIVKAGAKVAIKSKEEVLTEDDIVDWVDEHGFLSETVQNIIIKFTESLSEGVPKNEIAVKPQRVKKATPQKKK